MSTVAGEEPVTTDLVSEPGPVTVQQSLQGTVASNFPSDLSLDSLGGGASNGPAGPPTDLTTSWRPPQGDEASGYLPAPPGASDGLPPGSGDLPAVLDPHSFVPPFPDQEPPPLIASGPVTENPNRILGDVAADIAQVPEPSTLLLMALGVLAAECGRRRGGRQPPV